MRFRRRSPRASADNVMPPRPGLGIQHVVGRPPPTSKARQARLLPRRAALALGGPEAERANVRRRQQSPSSSFRVRGDVSDDAATASAATRVNAPSRRRQALISCYRYRLRGLLLRLQRLGLGLERRERRGRSVGNCGHSDASGKVVRQSDASGKVARLSDASGRVARQSRETEHDTATRHAKRTRHTTWLHSTS